MSVFDSTIAAMRNDFFHRAAFTSSGSIPVSDVLSLRSERLQGCRAFMVVSDLPQTSVCLKKALVALMILQNGKSGVCISHKCKAPLSYIEFTNKITVLLQCHDSHFPFLCAASFINTLQSTRLCVKILS